MPMHTLFPSSKYPLSFLGPDLEEGPLSAVFYFALSARESLLIDPFNQMPAYLSSFPVRVFSVDLPGHGEGLEAVHALKIWAESIRNGSDIVHEFVSCMKGHMEALKERGLLIPEKTFAAGLSRGAFIATHVAAAVNWVPCVLGFAPLTSLRTIKEFQGLSERLSLSSFDLDKLSPLLIHKKVRFYISNHDTRVGTDRCFQFISLLAKSAIEGKVRSPQVELFIKHPIGHQGHGTPKETFEEGARFLLKEWGL